LAWLDPEAPLLPVRVLILSWSPGCLSLA
jgi:hypothetical protein